MLVTLYRYLNEIYRAGCLCLVFHPCSSYITFQDKRLAGDSVTLQFKMLLNVMIIPQTFDS